jgi:hypothetical protein
VQVSGSFGQRGRSDLFAAVGSAGTRRSLVAPQSAISLNALLPSGLGASNCDGQVEAPAGGSLPVPFNGTQAEIIAPEPGLLSISSLPPSSATLCRTLACPKLKRVLIAAETGTFADRFKVGLEGLFVALPAKPLQFKVLEKQGDRLRRIGV